MAKKLITQEFRGSIVVVEGGKRLAGVTIIDTFEVTDEDGDAHTKAVPREADAGELTLLLGEETAVLRTANATLNGQNSELKAQNQTLIDLVGKQRAALTAVAEADRSWDDDVRSAVLKALEVGV